VHRSSPDPWSALLLRAQHPCSVATRLLLPCDNRSPCTSFSRCRRARKDSSWQAVGNYVRENSRDSASATSRPETFMKRVFETSAPRTTWCISGVGTGVRSASHRRDVSVHGQKRSLQKSSSTLQLALFGSSKQIVLTSIGLLGRSPTLEDRLEPAPLGPDDRTFNLLIFIASCHQSRARALGGVGTTLLDFIASEASEGRTSGSSREPSSGHRLRQLEPANCSPASWLNRFWLTLWAPNNRAKSHSPAGSSRSVHGTFGFQCGTSLIGPSRRRPLVIARQIAMYLFRETH